MIRLDPEGRFTKSMVLTTASRAVWFQDVKLATVAITSSKAVAAHLKVDQGRGYIKDPVNFTKATNEAKAESIKTATEEFDTAKDARRRRSASAAALRRRLKLWLPFNAMNVSGRSEDQKGRRRL